MYAAFRDPDTGKEYRTRTGYIFGLAAERTRIARERARQKNGAFAAIILSTGLTLTYASLFPLAYVISFGDPAFEKTQRKK